MFVNITVTKVCFLELEYFMPSTSIQYPVKEKLPMVFPSPSNRQENKNTHTKIYFEEFLTQHKL